MAVITGVEADRLDRKVFKPIGGSKRLYPSIPGFDEFAILKWVCTGNVHATKSLVHDYQKMIFDDAGLILSIDWDVELRAESLDQQLATSVTIWMTLDDFRITDIDLPIPTTWKPQNANVQDYLHNFIRWENLFVPIIEDDVLYPRIEVANVFGSPHDMHFSLIGHVFYLKTK